LKTELALRPVYHRKPERIRAHVLICWLALLLIRIAENETGLTWFKIRRLLNRISLVTLQMHEGVVHQSTELSDEQKSIYLACKVNPPPRIARIQAT
jgi:transposase